MQEYKISCNITESLRISVEKKKYRTEVALERSD